MAKPEVTAQPTTTTLTPPPSLMAIDTPKRSSRRKSPPTKLTMDDPEMPPLREVIPKNQALVSPPIVKTIPKGKNHRKRIFFNLLKNIFLVPGPSKDRLEKFSKIMKNEFEAN